MLIMLIRNRKAQFNYKVLEKFEAGLILSGGEVKAIKRGHADLSGAYAKIVVNEAYLINASIPVEGKKDYSPTRSRKMLLHKREIVSIQSKIKANKLTLIPTKMYNKGRLIKAEIALAKSKRKFEKKESIKRKDIERELAQELKGKY